MDRRWNRLPGCRNRETGEKEMARWGQRELYRRRHRYLEAHRRITYYGDHPLTRSGEGHESEMHSASFASAGGVTVVLDASHALLVMAFWQHLERICIVTILCD
jgi:hypothetical protein